MSYPEHWEIWMFSIPTLCVTYVAEGYPPNPMIHGRVTGGPFETQYILIDGFGVNIQS